MNAIIQNFNLLKDNQYVKGQPSAMKIKIIIGGKVPGKYTQHRQHFGNIEIYRKSFIEHVNKHIV
jgi:hypothetical protein